MRLKERCFSLRPCSPHLQGISLQVMCHNIFGFLQHIHCQSQNKNKRRIHRTTWLSSTGCPLSLVSPCPSSASTHPPAVWQMLNKNPPGVWQILSENPSFMLVSFLSPPTWTTLLSWYLLIFLSSLTNTADYWQILTNTEDETNTDDETNTNTEKYSPTCLPAKPALHQPVFLLLVNFICK